MRRFAGLLLAVAVLGAQPARAVFVFTFDENGHGVINVNGGGNQNVVGTLLPDPTQPGNPGALTYIFGPLGGLVGEGDVGIFEDAAHTIRSDGLRFTDANGGLTGGNGDRLIFYSLPGGGDLADTGIPANFTVTSGVTEAANGTFQFVAGTPPNANIYNGTSTPGTPSAVPEPSTVVGAGTAALAGLGFWLRKRRKA